MLEWVCLGCLDPDLQVIRSDHIVNAKRREDGSKRESDGMTISPIWRKPKKHMQEAAHSMEALWFSTCSLHITQRPLSIGGLIGSLVWVEPGR